MNNTVDSSSQALPTGVVTFLLTDIEGSTRRWELEPEAMRAALVRHDALVGACIQQHHGHLVKSKGEGDSAFAVFRHAPDAVAAALVVQCALSAEHWPTRSPIKVRMAIHTGQIELRDGDYFGTTVNRCARLRALARGGQVLLTGATAQLIQGQLPAGSSLLDLGTHQLKDLNAPERVLSLAHPQLAVTPTVTAAVKKASTQGPLRRAYKLTDHLNRSPDGHLWGVGVKHTASEKGREDVESRIRCYTSPAVAALLNWQNERLRLPRLWEAIVDVEPTRGDAIVACGEVATTRQVALAAVTGLQHARFAVVCARAADAGDGPHQDFASWASAWLSGRDEVGSQARALADLFESQARRGGALIDPELQMLANAARAAMHASKLLWLDGRARDEANARAADLAGEAVHSALRQTRLDLPALAESILPRSANGGLTLPPVRSLAAAVPGVPIMKALPT